MHAPTRWRLVNEDSHAPLENLARDEAIARNLDGSPTLRLWRNLPCVVVGRFQVSDAEVDRRACAAAGVPVYRRFTGGGAVFHDLGNLNISLALPRDDEILRSNPALLRVPGVYSLVLEPLANALRAMGLKPMITPRELLIGNKKVSGAAAWFGRNTILVHATLIVDSDLGLLERVLDGPGAPGNVRWERTKSRRSRVTSLRREGVSHAAVELVQRTVIATFAARFKTFLENRTLAPYEEAYASQLLSSKYSLLRWHAEGQASEEDAAEVAGAGNTAMRM